MHGHHTFAVPGTRQEFRLPLGMRLFWIFAALAIAAATLFLIGMTVVVVPQGWAITLFLAAVSCFVAAFDGYVFRDLRAKLGLRVVLDAEAATLDLPSGRSVVHRPSALHLTVPYADIAAVETRLEGYRSLGMVFMQRAYVLCRKSGAPIFLFEDRALATNIATSFFPEIAAALATRAGVKIHDLGMVEGRGGFLGMWGTQTVDWGAPSLALARQMWLLRHAASTGSMAMAFILLGIALRIVFGWG